MIVGSVAELTPARLGRLGIESLLVDVDCTLKRYCDDTPTAGSQAWLAALAESKVVVCLVSNGRTMRIRRFAERVDLPFVARAMKPWPWTINRTVTRMQMRRGATALVGDQLLTDVLAGKLAGLTTVLVEPIQPQLEPWFARWKRPIERWILEKSSKTVFPE